MLRVYPAIVHLVVWCRLLLLWKRDRSLSALGGWFRPLHNGSRFSPTQPSRLPARHMRCFICGSADGGEGNGATAAVVAAGPLSEEEATFQSLGLCDWILTSCKAMGFRRPTPVQRHCIPAVSAAVYSICSRRFPVCTPTLSLGPVEHKVAIDLSEASRREYAHCCISVFDGNTAGAGGILCLLCMSLPRINTYHIRL